MKIVVIGGTGLIGSKVVKLLAAKGHQPLAAAPNTGFDATTGQGVAEALAGAEVVVDLSNSRSFDEPTARAFFESSGKTLAREEKAAGVRHHVALSVVGTERLQDSGYFRAKLAQEGLIESSGIPYTIVRATQFFEFLGAIADSGAAEGGIRLPSASFQPIAADDVAANVVAAALGAPVNGIVEIAGPERQPMFQFVGRYLERTDDHRKVVGDAQALYFGARVDDRSLVPGDNPHIGSISLDAWLRDRAAAKGAHA
jgi:uncharacterized protein YbjT (DUF2867 family)